jgi:hypothetical protein
MSPSESDLRAALHDGDGDPLDVDSLLGHAQARAAQRRVRMLSTAAIVAVVAGAGVGGGYLLSSGSDSRTSSTAGGAGSGVYGAESGGSERVAVNTAPSAAGIANGYAGAAGCPVQPTATAGSAKSTAHVTMFSAPVRTVVLCAYDNFSTVDASHSRKTDPASVVLRGKQAERLLQSLKQAPTERPTTPCPFVRTVSRPLVIVALTSDGTVAGVATTNLGVPVCNVVVVNDAATRYSWRPPADLSLRLATVLAPPAPAATPTH